MKIALVGNQNSGKTTLFNELTGMNQKIGNWPGVTIEKKIGIIKDTNYELIDLPGIYSLTPYTMEEKISKNFIIEEKVDLIIDIIDVTSIERGLYLTTELLDLETPVLVVLNMIDRLKSRGLEIQIDKLKEKLGVNACAISALKREGIDELVQLISSISRKKFEKIKIFPREIEEIIYDIEKRNNIQKNKRYYALQTLKQSNIYSVKLLQEKIINKYNMDIDETIITLRYKYISNIVNDCIKKIKTPKNISNKIDKVFK